LGVKNAYVDKTFLGRVTDSVTSSRAANRLSAVKKCRVTKGLGVGRYVDDFVILARRTGVRTKQLVEQTLQGRFDLKVNADKTAVCSKNATSRLLDGIRSLEGPVAVRCKRRRRIDRAMELARIVRLARDSGLLFFSGLQHRPGQDNSSRNIRPRPQDRTVRRRLAFLQGGSPAGAIPRL
jgi:hypothetical protein